MCLTKPYNISFRCTFHRLGYSPWDRYLILLTPYCQNDIVLRTYAIIPLYSSFNPGRRLYTLHIIIIWLSPKVQPYRLQITSAPGELDVKCNLNL